MSFRFQDLSINVVPKGAGKVGFTPDPNCPGTSVVCGGITRVGCLRGSIVCPDITVVGCRNFTACRPLSVCAGFSLCQVTLPCKFTLCGDCSFLSPIVLEPGQEVILPEALAALKEELQLALQEVEAHEQDVAQRAAPGSVEEIDELTQKLEGALEQLKSERNRIAGS
jgi:hypothetical protein